LVENEELEKQNTQEESREVKIEKLKDNAVLLFILGLFGT
jgi:hypothetical protein